MRVASAQYNYAYGGQIHYPYSVGTIAAALRQVWSDIELLPAAVQRGQIATHAERVAAADLFLGSCYVWNWAETRELIRAAKAKNPRLTVLLGGPQVPDDPAAAAGALDEMQADALVHGEGEVVVCEVVGRWRCGSPLAGPGVTTRAGTGPQAPRLTTLDGLPSPYLAGVIDELAEPLPEGWKYVAAWETTRGCPYKCTFCDWGSATYTKLRQFPMPRLYAEIGWFESHGVEYIDCCDANFGILRERDRALAEALASRSPALPPLAFRSSWAKNSSAAVIEVAKPLKDAGMLTAVGLALESLDPVALDAIKRRNLPMATYGALTKQFAEAGIPTYTELILGLPGETLESWTHGLGVLLEESAIGQVYVYNCSVLPNAPMADPAYRAEHGILTRRAPIWLAHSRAGEQGEPEWEDIVVQTATMPRYQMKAARLIAALAVLGEQLGVFAPMARAWNEEMGEPRIRFYADVLPALGRDGGWTRFGAVYDRITRQIAAGYQGDGWGIFDDCLGPIQWPIEEWAWLTLCRTPSELRHMLYDLGTAIGFGTLAHEIADETVATLHCGPEGNEDAFPWARDMMWFGRRRGAFRRCASD